MYSVCAVCVYSVYTVCVLCAYSVCNVNSNIFDCCTQEAMNESQCLNTQSVVEYEKKLRELHSNLVSDRKILSVRIDH